MARVQASSAVGVATGETDVSGQLRLSCAYASVLTPSLSRSPNAMVSGMSIELMGVVMFFSSGVQSTLILKSVMTFCASCAVWVMTPVSPAGVEERGIEPEDLIWA